MPHGPLLRRPPSPPRPVDEASPSAMPSAGEELPPQDLRQLARDLHLAKLRVRQRLLHCLAVMLLLLASVPRLCAGRPRLHGLVGQTSLIRRVIGAMLGRSMLPLESGMLPSVPLKMEVAITTWYVTQEQEAAAARAELPDPRASGSLVNVVREALAAQAAASQDKRHPPAAGPSAGSPPR